MALRRGTRLSVFGYKLVRSESPSCLEELGELAQPKSLFGRVALFAVYQQEFVQESPLRNVLT